ncbi:MAG TPA: hypothetical protein VIU62_19335 [Chloroflexota bacterium]
MRFWRRGPVSPTVTGDARRRQVVAQARAVMAKLRTEGQPPAYVRSLEPFIDRAPEVLALGPAPASLTMRLLYGLCTFQGEALTRFEAALAGEFAAPSPTLRAVLRSELVTLDEEGRPRVAVLGRELFNCLRERGAFDGAE